MAGEIIRKAAETKLKRYWYCLLGKELYVYKNKKEEKVVLADDIIKVLE